VNTAATAQDGVLTFGRRSAQPPAVLLAACVIAAAASCLPVWRIEPASSMRVPEKLFGMTLTMVRLAARLLRVNSGLKARVMGMERIPLSVPAKDIAAMLGPFHETKRTCLTAAGSGDKLEIHGKGG
jgi:hypothetical protein